jgi:hypothetical protein
MFTKNFSPIIPFVAMVLFENLEQFYCFSWKKVTGAGRIWINKELFWIRIWEAIQMRQDQIRKTAPMCTYDNH